MNVVLRPMEASVEFVWWGGGGVGWGWHGNFHVQPNYSVVVMLHCDNNFEGVPKIFASPP